MDEKLRALLNMPLNRANVKTRKQSGTELSYIEGHTAIREANRIFGFEGWDLNVESFETVSTEQYEKAGYNNGPAIPMHRVCICALVSIHALGVCRKDVGYGSGSAKTLADANESAGKEAVTDAMKRALRTFGDQFGNALYDKDQKHVADVLDEDAIKAINEATNTEELRKVWFGACKSNGAYTKLINKRKESFTESGNE